MTAHISEAQARQLGLYAKRSVAGRQRKEPRAGAVSVCVACGAEFSGDTAEDRHVDETHHLRYRSVLEPLAVE